MLGVAFYIDEMTMSFKDHQAWKKDDIKSKRIWFTDIYYFSEIIHI